jgi:antitoxin YefM
MAISASEARKRLYPLIEKVNSDHEPVEIVTRAGTTAVLVSKDEFDSWRETAYLFRSPANAERLLRAYRDATQGRAEHHELVVE